MLVGKESTMMSLAVTGALSYWFAVATTNIREFERVDGLELIAYLKGYQSVFIWHPPRLGSIALFW